MKAFARNSFGYSLIELMVVLAIVGLMGLGTTTLVTNMLKLSTKQVLKKELIHVQNNLEQNIKNNDAWANTIANNANLQCLEENDDIPCNENLGAPISGIRIFDRAGAEVYNEIPGTNGWTLEGNTCTTFNNVAGNNACPFRYDLQVEFDCPGAETACLKPKVTVRGVFLVRPADDTSPANQVKPDEYNFLIVREQEVIYEPLEVIYNVTTDDFSGPDEFSIRCPNTGAAAVRNRGLNMVTMDVGGNILETRWNQRRFRLAAGRYDCEVYAQAFQAMSGFSISLWVMGQGEFEIGAGSGGYGSVSNVTGNVTIELNADRWIRIRHRCGLTTATNSRTIYDLGIPAPVTTAGSYCNSEGMGTVLTRVSCVRNR